MTPHNVRLTVSRLDPDNPTGRPGKLLLDLDETEDTLADRAAAWATVRGYDRLVPALHRFLNRDEPPESGFAILINRPHSLLIVAWWPWCPGRPS